MNHEQIDQDIEPTDEAPVNPGGRWDELAHMIGYANVAPLIADLRVAYDNGSMARAKGRSCSPIAYRGAHANAWVDGWLGLKKPEA